MDPIPFPRRIRRRGAAAVLAGGALLSALLTACSTVPITGRRSLNVIPDSQAEALGADAYKQVLAEATLIRSGPDFDRVVRVGTRLAAVSDQPGLAWEFSLIDDPKTVNAFCLPGGKVAVYTGLLPVAENDAGLAFVMGHEIAHAIARHGSERMSNQLALSVAQVGLTEILGRRDESTRELVLAAFGAGATVGVMLPFGRHQESEADLIGLHYMARAGYDPHEAPRFWERMSAMASGAQPPTFLSTHPSHETRIRDLEALIPEVMQEYRPQ
jgi:predicted Zn-dependent protease